MKLVIKVLKTAYEKIWVPIFGRLLMSFSSLIEGRIIVDKPTFQYKNNDKN